MEASDGPERITIKGTIQADNLGKGEIIVSRHVEITGDGTNAILNAASKNRIFNITNPGKLTIKDLKLTKGLAGSSDTSDHGGAICNAGELTVISCEIIGNTAKTSSGGGVFVKAGGKCTITGTSSRKSIIGKNASPKGAGIQIEGECTIGEYTVIGGSAENANKGNARVTPSINSEKNTPGKNDSKQQHAGVANKQ